MYILGMLLAVVMGILLGMLGGGGSILTVPILVYLLGVSEDHGPSYSLFVVGVVAATGSVQYLLAKQFSLKTALLFGIPSMLMVYVNQRFIRPAIPEQILIFGEVVGRGTLLMGLFAVMMLLASWSMVRKKKRQTTNTFEIGDAEQLPPVKTIMAGLVEGLLTGLVGAGGGFIIVPALVTITKLPMKKAVGTSLIIMAVKSLIGFAGALQVIDVDWMLLLPFTGIAAVGVVIGARFAKNVPADKLKLAFGWLVMVMGTFVVIKTIVDA